MSNNPLLDFSGLPRFGEIAIAHITPAVDQLLTENRTLMTQLSHQSDAAVTWGNFVLPLEDANERLSRAWGTVSHLNAVMNSPEWRAAYNENLPKITEYYSELTQQPDLFRLFRALRQDDKFNNLNAAQQTVIQHELRDFRLGGAELDGVEKARFRAIQSELAQHSARFEENILDATNAYALFVDCAEDLTGLPEDVMRVAQAAAARDQREGWKFTLHAPSYLPFMQYVVHRGLREQMYRAYATRASETGPAEWDNSTLMVQILNLRQEEARLLGFANYVELSLASKMAETPQQVENFLSDLAQRARPFAERDRDDLHEFARTKLGIETLQAWDIAFASEQLRLALHHFSDQEVRQYFPESQVLSGLFKLISTLYGLEVRPATAAVWHPDVRFYEIVDATGELIGQFYLDLYAREHKRGGAWMDDTITRRKRHGIIQYPVTYLTCNFSAPAGEQDALFTHDEVLTLFHEFGHGLHHLMTQVEELSVSGIHGVEWDAVELPSQFMENFCWEWDVLQPMTRHIQHGTPLPRDLFNKMVAAKNFQSGLFTLRQIEFALFDFRLHTGEIRDGAVLKLLNEVRAEVSVLIPPEFNRFPHSFAHIFSGGYAAGYYSYKWAEVLSADVYSLFEEQGVLSQEVGQRFWREILAVGGVRSARDSFIAFRGREPNVDALLRHNGMV
jgi:oligopeptidase A